MFDVVVIGGGMAGVTAALAAQREGAKVAVATRAWGATAMGTGALDLAYTPALSPSAQLERTVAEHVMDIIAHRHRHPFGVLGLERTLMGMTRGYEALAGVLAGTDVALPRLDLEAANGVLPSALGVGVPAAVASGAHRGVDLMRGLSGRWGVLQLAGDGSFDARRLVAGWQLDAERLGAPALELTVVDAETDGVSSPLLLARRFDDIEQVEKLAAQLKPKVRGLGGLIVAPVLGLVRSDLARGRLREALGIDVVEALAYAPSVPGVRLQRALDVWLGDADVELVGEVTGFATAGSRVASLRTYDGIDIRAGTVVLATGRYIAGGVVWNERCEEALFGLPVVSELGPLEEDSPHPVVRETPVESHPLMTAGVQVNEDLQPVAEGRVAYSNLYAAGMVIGGFASRYALCADGVALCSGFLAGQAAAGRL